MSVRRLVSPTILPYYICVGEWTAKRAAILGIVLSGTSVTFLFATAFTMEHINASWGQKDLGAVFGFALGVAFSVLFICCSVAAILSFFVSVWLIISKRFFGLREVSPGTLTAVPGALHGKLRHPAVALAGLTVLIASTRFGPATLVFVGIPAMLVASGLAGGARSPTQVPLRDAILYVGLSVAIVAGILVYTLYRH